jgi:hypothetical protein
MLFYSKIKSGQTIAVDFFCGLTKWVAWAGAEAGRPSLVYGGDEHQERSQTEVIPWRDIERLAGAV